MLELLNRLIDVGNHDGTMPRRRKWIRLSNLSALLSFLGFALHAIVFGAVGIYHLSFLIGLIAFAQFGVLFLNHYQVFQINWLTYQFVNSFFLFYFSTILGPQVPTFWFYIIVLKTAFIYSFGRRHIWLKRGLNVFLLSLIIADLVFRVKPFGSVIVSAQYLDFFA
ncbi:MAG: hypothetical protein AAFQ68_08010, partial [Bacteroidota bacterium]